EILAALAPQPVRQAMGLDGVEALEVEYRLEEAVGRRVAVEGGDDIGAEGDADRRVGFERILIGLPDQLRRYLGTVGPLAQPLDDVGFPGVVVQDRRIDEGRELGLAAHHLLGLRTDAGPNRIDLVERADGFRLLASHVLLLAIDVVRYHYLFI